MMHASRPAFTHRLRNTVLSTLRAGGFRPNEMFESPRIVRTPGNFSLICRMASMVSLAASRSVPSPLHTVNVSVSISRSPRRMPRDTQKSIRRPAISTLRSAVIAMPTSSMVSATSPAPKRRASSTSFSAFSSPDSKLMELTSMRPPWSFSAASTTSSCVLSTMIGRRHSRPARATSVDMSTRSSRPA